MNFPTLLLTGPEHAALLLGTAAVFIAIIILWYEMRSTVYRVGCEECKVARANEEKQKSAGPDKGPNQRNLPGAGNGGWRA